MIIVAPTILFRLLPSRGISKSLGKEDLGSGLGMESQGT